MDDFQSYQLAVANKKAAYAEYNYASKKLEHEQIMERLAEIKSQHEPMASLLNENRSERDRLYAIAFFVVLGRFPPIE
jgi:hypothetical protein